MAVLNTSLLLYNTTRESLQNASICEDSTAQKVTKITAFGLLMLFSLVGNALVVVCFFKNQELRTPVNYFIVNMSISDLCIPVFALPRRLGWLIVGPNEWLVNGQLGSFLCKLLPFAEDVSTYVSKLSMVVVAIERFYSVVFALKPALVTNRSCTRLIALTWIIGMVFSAHFFYSFKLIHDNEAVAKCVFRWNPASQTAEAFKIQWIINFVCFTVVPFVVLTLLYVGIAVSLYRQKKVLRLAASTMSKRRAIENRKIACMLFTVMVVFLAAYAPYHVHIFLYYFAPEIKRSCSFQFIADYSQFTYTVINPLVYYVFSENYRRGFKELLCCAVGRCVKPLCCALQKRREARQRSSQITVISRLSQCGNDVIQLQTL